MKFPAGQATVWGIIILLSVQLYLYLYLKQLNGKLGESDPGWDVPWIGMDTSRPARVIFLTTVLVLPCSAVGALATYSALHRWPSLARDSYSVTTDAALTGAFIFAAILGALSWKYRPKVQATSEDPVRTDLELSAPHT